MVLRPATLKSTASARHRKCLWPSSWFGVFWRGPDEVRLTDGWPTRVKRHLENTMRFTKVAFTFASVVMTALVHGQNAPPSAAVDVRIFDFSATLAGKRLIDGTVTVYPDSMVVTPKSGRCVALPYGNDAATIARFKCDEVREVENMVLAFERSAPDHATWTGMAQRTATSVRRVCTTGGPPSRANTIPCPSGIASPASLPPSQPVAVKGAVKMAAKK